MDIRSAAAYLENITVSNSVLGLENIRALLGRLGNPEKKLKIIHIAGTNGKGSTAQMIKSILLAGGYNVGIFTSPPLIRINEQIAVNDAEISDKALADYVERLIPVMEKLNDEGIYPTYFETITAVSFLYFYESEVDFAVLETGLGGEKDATNVIDDCVLSVFTKIEIDHTDVLGKTLSEIAEKKAGIIKPNGMVVSAVQKAEAERVLRRYCEKQNARLYLAPTDEVRNIKISENGTDFQIRNMSYHTSLMGAHQAYNAAIAIKAVEVLNENGRLAATQEDIRKGIFEAKWAGRFEKVCESPRIFIDGAHNPDGIKALGDVLDVLGDCRKIAVIGMLRDKDIDSMLSAICVHFDEIITSVPDNPRAVPALELAEKAKLYHKKVDYEEDCVRAVCKAMDKAGENGMIVAFGSLYMIGKIRLFLQGRQA
ncbi:MAG: bifunctional folylpolyglutamate synthase/dihydrofolate synthase [Clostridia bacterium]|nr:bifunctional folylpolyglutamate synthase/dihydrofolate synthase [Clostridia bacterium]